MPRPSLLALALAALAALAALLVHATAEHTQSAFVAAPWHVHGAAAVLSNGAVRLSGGAVSAAVSPPPSDAAWELRADLTLAATAVPADACTALWAVAAPFARGSGALCGGPARFAGVAATVHNGTAALLVGDGTGTATPVCALELPETATETETAAAPVHLRVRIAATSAGHPTLRVALGARDAPLHTCTAAPATPTVPVPTAVAASATPTPTASDPAVRLRALALVPGTAAEPADHQTSPQLAAIAALTRRVETVAAAVRSHTAAEHRKQHHQQASSEGAGATLAAALADLEAGARGTVAAAQGHDGAAEGAYRAVQRTHGSALRSTGAVRRYVAQERVLGGRRVSARMVAAHYGADRGTVALLAVLGVAAAAAAAFLWCHAHGLTDRLFHEKIY